MKVSVVIPVYNTEQYLKKCLDSILNQTLDNIEVVAVDDGSTDSSGRILDEYAEKHPEIKVFHQKNGGQAKARNLALKHCTGKYISFVDSDDYIKLNAYEVLYSKAENEDLDYIGLGYTDFVLEDDQEVVVRAYKGQKPCKTAAELYRDFQAYPYINFFRKELLDQSNAYFPEGLIYEDTAFFMHILPWIKRPGCIEESLGYRLRRTGSTTTIANPQKVAQIFPIIENIYQYYHKTEAAHKYLTEMEYFCVRILLCSSLKRIARIASFSDRRRLIQQTWQTIDKLFPDYRKNTYFNHSKTDLYIKHANHLITQCVCELQHYFRKDKWY